MYKEEYIFPDKLYPLVGHNICQLRKRYRMTQAQLAERLGLDQKQISLIENGKAKPGLSVCLRIANVFQVSIDRLLFGALQMDILCSNLSGSEQELVTNLLEDINQYLLFRERDNHCADSS